MTTKTEIVFEEVVCATETCHTLFLIPEGVTARLRKSHRNFYCPFGHTNHYPQKTDEDILKESLLKKTGEIRELRQELEKKNKSKRKRK